MSEIPRSLAAQFSVCPKIPGLSIVDLTEFQRVQSGPNGECFRSLSGNSMDVEQFTHRYSPRLGSLPVICVALIAIYRLLETSNHFSREFCRLVKQSG